jgi:hypothetical protein
MDPNLQELLDKQAINDVIARYCRALDWLDEESLITVFWSDAVIDHGYFQGSGEEFIPVVMKIERANLRRWHFCGNTIIHVDRNLATSETYGLAQATNRQDDTLMDTIIAGRYLDQFEKREGVWRILKREYVLDWTQRFPNSLSGDGLQNFPLNALTIDNSDHPRYRKL